MKKRSAIVHRSSRRVSARSAAAAWALAVVVVASACTGIAGGRSAPGRVLRVVMADDWAGVPAVVDAVRSFETEHPGVEVHIQGVPFPQIPDVVRTSIAAGDPVEVAHWHAFAAAAQGLAQPVDDLWAGTLDPEGFLPGTVEDVTWRGRRYGVPLDANALLLMANPALLEQRGIAPPDGPLTFADVEAIARGVTRPAGDVRGLAIPNSTWFAYGWIRANGGELVEVADDGAVTFTLDAPQAVDALGFLGHLIAEGLAYPPSTRNVSHDAFALFRSGSTALHASGLWDVADLEGSATGWAPAVLPMPRGREGVTRGTALGGSSLFVPPDVDDRELAFAFMVHLITDEHAHRLAVEEGRLPVRRALFDAPYFDRPALRTARSELEVAHPMQLIAFPEALRAFTEAYEDVLMGRRSAEEALARAQRRAETSVDSR